jgi:hypothetical protein
MRPRARPEYIFRVRALFTVLADILGAQEKEKKKKGSLTGFSFLWFWFLGLGRTVRLDAQTRIELGLRTSSHFHVLLQPVAKKPRGRIKRQRFGKCVFPLQHWHASIARKKIKAGERKMERKERNKEKVKRDKENGLR